MRVLGMGGQAVDASDNINEDIDTCCSLDSSRVGRRHYGVTDADFRRSAIGGRIAPYDVGQIHT